MILCVIEAGAALIWFFLARKKGILEQRKAVIVVLLATGILGICLQISEDGTSILNDKNQIRKNEPGQGEIEETLQVEIPDLEQEGTYTVEIEEQYLTKQEQETVFQNAKSEAEKTFLGTNPSLEEVTENVCLPDTLQDGLVTAEWSFDNYEVMNPDGSINQDKVQEGGTLVKAKVILTCQETTQVYEFYFKVWKRKLSETEKMWESLSEALEKKNQGKETESYYSLPEEVDGHTVIWQEKKSQAAVNFAFLGIVAAAALVFKEKEEEKKKQEIWEKEMLLAYPEMVSKLTLLLGAGMSMTLAWEKIVLTYQKQLKQGLIKKQAVYQEMLVTYYEMQDGMGELKAYTRFGERCCLQQYRKLVSLITQNLRKGQQELTKLLEEEVREAFTVRKDLARKAGEEAGTKLLLPMMIMLLLVMVVILVPACMSFQM